MTRGDDEPAGLPRHAREVLARYVDEHTMPPDAVARVELVIRRPAPRLPIAVIALLAVAAGLLLAWALNLAWRPSVATGRDPGFEQATDRRGADAPATSAVASLPPAELPGTPSSTPAPAVAPDVTPPSVRRPRGPEATPAVRDDANTLATERSLLSNAWQALADDDVAQALRLVDQHRLSFARGVLAPEREALRAIARCRRSPAASKAILADFERISAPAALRARVRDACTTSP